MMMPTSGFTGSLYRWRGKTLNRRLFEGFPQAAEQLPGGSRRLGRSLFGPCLACESAQWLQAGRIDQGGQFGPCFRIVGQQSIAPLLDRVFAPDSLTVDFAATGQRGTDRLD